MARGIQSEFSFDDWGEVRHRNKAVSSDEVPVDQDYMDAILRIFRAYKAKWGAAIGLSERELDMSVALAQYMAQTKTRREPVWWIDDEGVSCVGLHRPKLRRDQSGVLPLLQDLDRLMEPGFNEGE